MLGWLIAILFGVGTAYGGLALFAWLCSDALIFPAPPPSYTDSPDQNKLTSADGNQITAVFLPNPAASHVLLYGHGNKQDLGTAQERLQAYREHGWAVFAYDYPGYGTSTGQPGEAGCYAAIDAAYAYLTKTKNFPPEKIVLYGQSLGAGATVDLASRAPVGGLILEGAFVSSFRVLTRWRLLPWDKFKNLEKIVRVRAPLLSIHGTADQTVPLWHGKALFSAHPGSKHGVWISGAGHNNILETAPQAYWDAIEQFRLRLVSAGPA